MSVRARRFLAFWKAQGTVAVIRLVRAKLADVIAGRPVFNEIESGGSADRTRSKPSTIAELNARRFGALQPLPTYLIPRGTCPRINLITDSIGRGSLFGGVGTGLIFAALLANRMNGRLRVVTRTEKPTPGNVAEILGAYGIELVQEVQFAFSPSHDLAADEQHGIDVDPDEIFLTTSWWTTAATLPSVPAASIVYLLQEDERMFYPFGEDRFRCEKILMNQDIRFVINTRLLFEHLVEAGLGHLSTQGQWFEPAFPSSLFYRRSKDPSTKKRLFYYARPHNPRNLFHVGLEVIEQAILKGFLDLDRWDIYLVGKDIPSVLFGDGYIPKRCEGLDWRAYADLIGTIDLGLSLMYTPHPSYPPLDLAASGAVVVTNKWGRKQDLSAYSENIICAELEVAALVDALEAGIERVERESAVGRADVLGRDWAESFEGVLQALTASR